MENNKFTSRTKEVRAIITEFMAEREEPVERKEIAEYVVEHVTEEVTDGVIAGAIKMMTASGELYPIQRGRYTRGTGKAKATAFEKIYTICRRFDSDLEKGCTFNMLELTEAERQVYMEFSACIMGLRNLVRESMVDLTGILERVHGQEATGTPEEKEAKLPEQEEAKGDADSEVPEQEAGSQEAPAAEQDEEACGEAENQSSSENAKAEGEPPVTGKRGRKSKEK